MSSPKLLKPKEFLLLISPQKGERLDWESSALASRPMVRDFLSVWGEGVMIRTCESFNREGLSENVFFQFFDLQCIFQ